MQRPNWVMQQHPTMRQIQGSITHLRAPTRQRDEGRALARCPELTSKQIPEGIVAFYTRAWRNNKAAGLGMRVMLRRLVKGTKVLTLFGVNSRTQATS